MKNIFNVIANKRILVLIGVFSGVFSVLSFYYMSFYLYFIDVLNVNLSRSSLSITLVLVSIFSLSLIYLQSGGKDELHAQALMSKELEHQRRLIIEQLDELKEKFESDEIISPLSAEEKILVINGAIEQTSQESIKAIFATEAESFREEIKDSIVIERINELSYDITRRLSREIADLRLRSNVNLLIGMSITAGGLYLLWTTVSIVDSSELLKQLASEGDESNYKFIKNIMLPIIPRIMLVIFVEVFAYFFLRLYKNTLSEIKYFQNELTNVESKFAAAEFSFITNNSDGLKTSIKSLSKTERNFVLEKGQTTVELERAKSETELTRNIIKTIPAIFKKNNK